MRIIRKSGNDLEDKITDDLDSSNNLNDYNEKLKNSKIKQRNKNSKKESIPQARYKKTGSYKQSYQISINEPIKQNIEKTINDKSDELKPILNGKVIKPSFVPKHKKPLPKKFFHEDYNGFEPKAIKFNMYYSIVQYIGGLNRELRAGENQKTTTKRTPDNYCVFKNNLYRYGDLENRRKIRKELLKYTNNIEKNRELKKDEISEYIGFIEYRYDKFLSEVINEKVVEDAIRRMEGIDEYMKGRATTFCAFIINDRSREGLRMRVYAILKEKPNNDFFI